MNDQTSPDLAAERVALHARLEGVVAAEEAFNVPEALTYWAEDGFVDWCGSFPARLRMWRCRREATSPTSTALIAWFWPERTETFWIWASIWRYGRRSMVSGWLQR